jgi:subtilase family serine protease
MTFPERLKQIVLAALLVSASALLQAAPVQIPGHVPSAVAHLQPIGRLPATNQLWVVLGLPHRNQAELDGLLLQLQNPTSTNYHRWLTSDEFTARFGPTEEDYQKVISFAQRKGLKVAGLTPNRMLVDIQAPAADVERAFQVNLRLYPHPTENRNFYAPDAEPTVDADVPLVHIDGLDNYVLPHRLGSFKLTPFAHTNGVTPYYTGSGPGGNFMGNDFRAAYAPGVTNRGGGQYIAIIDVGGPLYTNDIYMYETNAGLSTNIVVTNILVDGGTGIPNGPDVDDGEQVIDITMAMSMAPDATILNYEGGGQDIFNRIATDNLAKQMTLSYGFGINISIIQSFQQFLAQGQAMSQASGDGDSDLDGGTGLTGNPYATIVGGTTLTTTTGGGPWSSETTWNWGGGGGSGGGISGYGIPDWQQGVATTANQGSTVFRNFPDVAMPADGIFLISGNGASQGSIGGTSCASPLWAGFMALINQQAATLGKPSVGFPNPAIYAIGKGNYSVYSGIFHDITTGNNFGPKNPTRFPATAGYDLCTGWGSPRGQATINALAGAGTNDFMFYSLPDILNIVRGGNAASWLNVTRMNGFTGAVTFTLSGMPAGVTASINPVTTATSNILSVAVSSTIVAGTYPITITGASGSLVHTVTMNVVVANPVPDTTQLALPYNRAGIWTDGRAFSGGADNGGSSYSANLLGTAPSWNGIIFNLGPTNANDVVSCAGQTLTLPAGSYTSLQLLGTAVDGSQSAQSFIITYTDGSTTTNLQSFSDWAYPQDYPGESVVLNLPYRNSSGGTKDLNTAVNVYNYVLPLDQTRTVASLKLPANGNVILFAATLANEPVPVSLASFYDVAGIYSDHVIFTNPPLGGADGGGYVYSGSIVPTAMVWTNVLFNFGPANSYNVTSNGYVLSATNLNVISATNQTIPLPAGNYSLLRMLASGVQGAQTNQHFIVYYADGTSNTFIQSLSDWYTATTYSGEVKALATYRNYRDGTADNRTFYLCGYAFKLNTSKVVQSVKLPNNIDVIVAAISLVPNWAPSFTLSPFSQPAVTAGQSYFGYIYTNASDLNGDAMTYAKVSGPAWLGITTGGVLSGTPVSTNVGLNTFVVSVTDTGSLSNTATMNINVLPAPAIVPSTYTDTNDNLWVTWSGGIAPYQLQMSTNLTTSNWVNVGGVISSNTVILIPSNPAAFFRIMGQ